MEVEGMPNSKASSCHVKASYSRSLPLANLLEMGKYSSEASFTSTNEFTAYPLGINSGNRG